MYKNDLITKSTFSQQKTWFVIKNNAFAIICFLIIFCHLILYNFHKCRFDESSRGWNLLRLTAGPAEVVDTHGDELLIQHLVIQPLPPLPGEDALCQLDVLCHVNKVLLENRYLQVSSVADDDSNEEVDEGDGDGEDHDDQDDQGHGAADVLLGVVEPVVDRILEVELSKSYCQGPNKSLP